MTEIWFYHLQSQPLERALPALAEKAVQRGWRIIIQTVDERRLKALDDLLWTYAPDGFLAHGSIREPQPERQPILLTCDATNANAAALRVYVEGAEIDLDPASAGYERVILLFDGRNEEEIAAARQQWSRLKTRGFSLAYWQQTDDGKWNRRT